MHTRRGVVRVSINPQAIGEVCVRRMTWWIMGTFAIGRGMRIDATFLYGWGMVDTKNSSPKSSWKTFQILFHAWINPQRERKSSPISSTMHNCVRRGCNVLNPVSQNIDQQRRSFWKDKNIIFRDRQTCQLSREEIARTLFKRMMLQFSEPCKIS